MEQDKADLEIGEVEGYTQRDEQFSHSSLVMSALRKCCEAGQSEMRNGYTTSKVTKTGAVVETYIPDGRKVFINCVKIAGETMSCDFDKEATDNISELLESFETKKTEFINRETETWKKMPEQQRRSMACPPKGTDPIYQMPGFIVLEFYKELLTEFQLEVYHDIFTELNQLTKRVDNYKSEQTEG